MSLESLRLQANDPDLFFVTVDKAEACALCDAAEAWKALRYGQRGSMRPRDLRQAFIKADAALSRLDSDVATEDRS